MPGTKLDLAMQLYEEFENENAESDEDAARSIDEARKIVERTKKAVEPRLKFEKRISDATDKDELFIAYVVCLYQLNHSLETNSNTHSHKHRYTAYLNYEEKMVTFRGDLSVRTFRHKLSFEGKALDTIRSICVRYT